MKEIHRRLRKIRHMQEKNQQEWADMLGVSIRAYGSYEGGKRDIPQSVLLKISEMGYSVEWLLTGQGSMKVSEIDYIPDDDQVDPPWEDDGMEIKDRGLDELLSPANRGKFLITEQEAEDLRNLAFRRKSKTTLQQWVSLLYMLREMDGE